MRVGISAGKQALASLLLSLLLAVCLLNGVSAADDVVEDLDVPVGNPNLAGFRFNRTLYGAAPKNQYTVYWNVDNEGTEQEQLHVVLRLTGPELKWAWVGIAFGRTMLDAEFIVCHQYPGKTELHEHFTRRQYAPPIDRDSSNAKYTRQAAVPIQGFVDANTLTCEFTRATKPSDPYHKSIDVTAFTDMLWAFNPQSEKNTEGKWFTYHGDTWRGALVSGLRSGVMSPVDTKSFQKKQLHGFGMMAVWFFLFPFGAFYARYLRSTAGWNIVHLIVQSLGVCAIIIFVVIITTDNIFMTRAHAYLGITMLGLILVQFLLGIANLLGLSWETAARLKKVVRRIHQFLGLSVMLMAIVQAGLGINKLYPWREPRGKAVWGIFIGLILFWVLLFIATEVYFRRSVRRKDVKAAGTYSDLRKVDATNTMVPMKQKVKRGETAVTLVNAANAASTTIPLEQTRLRPGLRQYTWETLNQAVMNGDLLVVANGRYVYSIAQWINSHPGGQLILHAVNGTDITNDYFHEAGFDADDFTPKPEAPAQRSERANAESSLGRRKGDLASLTSTEMNKSLNSFGDELVEEMKVAPTMNEKDWKLVVKSRRTNVHSRLAIERLSKLLVGELVPENVSSSSSFAVNAGAPFDPNEYRRYAMVENTPIAAQSSVVKFRFCLLYPYDVRADEPQVIFPGQAIEICARIKNKLVTRYYSPLSTSGLSTIEIMAKVYPDGVMTQYLFKQKPGDRQIKIRGPFGTPLFHPQKTLVPSDRVTWFPTNLLYIAGGTGITPFLQLLTAAIFPIAEPLRVHTEYIPQIEDELTLQRNDHVAVSHHYYDGWAVGTNLRTGQQGAFPLTVTVPYPGMNLLNGGKLTLIHAVRTAGEAILGDELLEGAMLAYPGVLEVHRFIADGTAPATPLGVLYGSQLSEPNLEDILHKRWLDNDDKDDDYEDEEKAALKQIVVCGPTGFGSWVVDTLSEKGVDMRRLVILPSDRVL